MKERLVSIACNNPDNGEFEGRATRVTFTLRECLGGAITVDLEHDDWINGCKITFLEDYRVRISRQVFRWKRRIPWHGNWCWDGLVMEKSEAKRLLHYLKNSGTWSCTYAPTRLFDWFNDEQEAAK